MFAIQKDVLYNTNMKKDMFAIKKNELSYGRGYVYSFFSFLLHSWIQSA